MIRGGHDVFAVGSLCHDKVGLLNNALHLFQSFMCVQLTI